jgi:hypothetical protein
MQKRTNTFDKHLYLFSCALILLCCIYRAAYSNEKAGTLKCVVAESSELITLDDGTRLQYLIIRHNDIKDRSAFSQWLHRNAGSYIQFEYNTKPLRGYIGRLKLCFGRGMLIVKTDTKIEQKSILFIPI